MFLSLLYALVLSGDSGVGAGRYCCVHSYIQSTPKLSIMNLIPTLQIHTFRRQVPSRPRYRPPRSQVGLNCSRPRLHTHDRLIACVYH